MQTQTDPTLDARVVAVIAQLTAVKAGDIKPRDRLREDLGMDSVSSMELISLLAEELDLDVDVEEALQVTTVDGAIELVKRRVAARAPRACAVK
jgi:acyl carrier protein